jgi:hypothetical protein
LTLTDLKVLEVRAVGIVTEGNVWVCEVRDFLGIVSSITEILWLISSSLLSSSESSAQRFSSSGRPRPKYELLLVLCERPTKGISEKERPNNIWIEIRKYEQYES